MEETTKDPQLLGKKREFEKERSQDDLSEKESYINNSENESVEGDDDNSSSFSEQKPKKYLSNKNEKSSTEKLFEELANPKLSLSLFPDSSCSTLFSNSRSFFESSQNELKSNNSFKFTGSLFNFSNANKKKDEEDEKELEEKDKIGKSKSPKHELNPENDSHNKEDKDEYIKRYNKKVDNVYLYDKLKKIFISRGEGYIVIETIEKENKDKKKERFARLVFRNTFGGILFQGIIHGQINKCITSEKKLKHICHFTFLIQKEENKELTLAQVKIPFTTQDEINIFTDKYKNTVKYIKNEIDDF